MIWIAVALIVLLLLDAGRMRGRLGALPTLPPSDQPPDPGHRFLVAPGVTVDDATRRAASAWARAEGVDVVDLVPRDLSTIGAMSLAQIVDPAQQRRDRFVVGRTASHAMLVAAEVAERAGVTGDPADELAFLDVAARLKRYASTGYAVAVAPAEHAIAPRLSRRRAVLRAVLGPMTPFALLMQPLLWALLGLGVWLAPLPGAIALGVWHLQPLLAVAGTPIRSRDLPLVVLLRAPIELYYLIGTLAGRWKPDAGPDPVEARRPEYARLLAGGTDRFLEPRRDTCPLCASTDLVVHRRCPDLLQHKPGRFTLERCRGCGHIFQNPGLSLEGLDFYYKDFYDGLGEDGMELIFGYSAASYRARAAMVAGVTTPARWLDVGAGHGHFCAAARDQLPDTRFDGLDFGDSIEDAHRRGWVDTAYRGLFPDLAPTFAGAYDTVSMSHYLEHTLDPRRELAAAHTALAPHGHLMIEVPDPDFVLGKLLRSYWLPWFQPQHQHIVSVANLERLLREHGFEPIAWHRGPAHQGVDFFSAVFLALGRIAPAANVPWRRGGAFAHVRRAVVWTVGLPLLAVGWAADRIATPIIKRSRVSNTYRVLAKRAD
ncbi:MAG: class I SAM-dependent methyltransferase [Myxococcales bacterium]|nr:class I SAM-dependent methyltransferase [Myxococcales bacterium]